MRLIQWQGRPRTTVTHAVTSVLIVFSLVDNYSHFTCHAHDIVQFTLGSQHHKTENEKIKYLVSDQSKGNQNGESNHHRTKLFTCANFTLNATRTSNTTNTITLTGGLQFGLTTGFGNCAGESFLVTFNISNLSNSTVPTPTAQSPSIIPNGFLKLGRELYTLTEYCILEYNDRVNMTLNVCQATCQDERPCVSKCCSLGKFLKRPLTDDDQRICSTVTNSTNGDPLVQTLLFHNPWNWRISTPYVSITNPHIRIGPPECKLLQEHETWSTVEIPTQYPKRVMRLQEDGSLRYLSRQHQSWVVLPRNSFCIDDLIFSNSNETDSMRYRLMLFKCVEEPIKINKNLSIGYVTSMFISSFFLLMTILIYIILKDKLLGSVHGWTLLSLWSSLFFFFIFLGSSHCLSLFSNSDLSDTPLCFIIGVMCHFLYISSFCWLFLITYDLWSTFRLHTPVGERSKGTGRFIVYNILAWGSATIVVTIGLVLNFVYSDIENQVVIPMYGVQNCFIAPSAMGYYIYSIIGVSMSMNLVFTVLTVLTIYKFRESTRMIQTHRPHQSAKLILKLFVIMGVTWIAEIISWLANREKTQLHWMLLDCVSISQGIGIFIIFICKRKTIQQLRQKFETWSICKMKRRRRPRHKATFTEHDQSTGVSGPATAVTQSIKKNVTGKTNSISSVKNATVTTAASTNTHKQ